MACLSVPAVARKWIPERRELGLLKAIARVFFTFVWTFSLLPFQMVSAAVGARLKERVPRFYHAGLCRIFGIGITVDGSPIAHRPALFVANHSSWLDILVLGSLVECSFVAKAEVALWPGVGFLAHLQRTEFVERTGRKAKAHVSQLQRRLGDGARLVMFPEGTSTDGSHVLPFKSALFSAVEGAPPGARPVVQPVTLAYVRVGDRPADQRTRPAVAWYGDMEFVPHIWGVFQLGSIGVQVTFHEQVPEFCYESRKALAAYCEEVIVAEHARLTEFD